MAKWRKSTHKMRHDWGLRTKPGNVVFIANRGQLRFDIPRSWVIEHDQDAVRFNDRKPPDDDCAMRLTVFHHPPGVDWTGLPVSQLLDHRDRDPTKYEYTSPVTEVRRARTELAWIELHWRDDTQGDRPALTRQAVARGPDCTALLTMDMWRDDVGRFMPVWDEVIRTLEFQVKINAPPPSATRLGRRAN